MTSKRRTFSERAKEKGSNALKRAVKPPVWAAVTGIATIANEYLFPEFASSFNFNEEVVGSLAYNIVNFVERGALFGLLAAETYSSLKYNWLPRSWSAGRIRRGLRYPVHAIVLGTIGAAAITYFSDEIKQVPQNVRDFFRYEIFTPEKAKIPKSNIEKLANDLEKKINNLYATGIAYSLENKV